MRLSYIISALEEYAPLSLQESWDNSGLQVSLPPEADGECTGVLLCLDVTSDVIAEAVRRGCNLVVSHHPLIFKGIRHFTGSTPAEVAVAAAIRAGVAVYSSHTAIDSAYGGVSYEMARRLGADVERVLVPSKIDTVILRATCPRRMSDDVRLILADIDGACTSVDADGTAVVGPDAASSELASVLQHEPLCRVETVLPRSKAIDASRALAEMPYGGKVKTELVDADGLQHIYGLGVVATFNEPIHMSELVRRLKEVFGVPYVKASQAAFPTDQVRRIALCGGSGGEFIAAAYRAGAQAYVTADVRYHDFADAASLPMAVFDIGHFESESCVKDIFYSVIKNKFSNFAVYFSETETNPVKYL